MAYKHIKFDESEVLRGFEKLADEQKVGPTGIPYGQSYRPSFLQDPMTWMEQFFLSANWSITFLQLMGLIPLPWGNPAAAAAAYEDLFVKKNMLSGFFWILAALPDGGPLARIFSEFPKVMAWLKAPKLSGALHVFIPEQYLIRFSKEIAKNLAQQALNLKNILLNIGIPAVTKFKEAMSEIEGKKNKESRQEYFKYSKQQKDECINQAIQEGINYLDKCASELNAFSIAQESVSKI